MLFLCVFLPDPHILDSLDQACVMHMAAALGPFSEV